jgi:hypothetical protein
LEIQSAPGKGTKITATVNKEKIPPANKKGK